MTTQQASDLLEEALDLIDQGFTKLEAARELAEGGIEFDYALAAAQDAYERASWRYGVR
jgi:hypothetical protein